MGRLPRHARELLRQARNLVTGVLVASAFATPALAATDIAIGNLSQPNLSQPILIGSLVLLVVGLVLKAKRDKTAHSAPPTGPRGFNEGIGRYRLQLGRGDAD